MNKLTEALNKAKTVGEQVWSMDLPGESYTLKVGLEHELYHGKHYYDIALGAYDEGGEIVDNAVRILVEDDLAEYLAERMGDEEELKKLRETIMTNWEGTKEETSAE